MDIITTKELSAVKSVEILNSIFWQQTIYSSVVILSYKKQKYRKKDFFLLSNYIFFQNNSVLPQPARIITSDQSTQASFPVLLRSHQKVLKKYATLSDFKYIKPFVASNTNLWTTQSSGVVGNHNYRPNSLNLSADNYLNNHGHFKASNNNLSAIDNNAMRLVYLNFDSYLKNYAVSSDTQLLQHKLCCIYLHLLRISATNIINNCRPKLSSMVSTSSSTETNTNIHNTKHKITPNNLSPRQYLPDYPISYAGSEISYNDRHQPGEGLLYSGHFRAVHQSKVGL